MHHRATWIRKTYTTEVGWIGLAQGRFCEHGNELPLITRRAFIRLPPDQQNDQQRLRNIPASSSSEF